MADKKPVQIPQLTATMTEGILVAWKKAPGDAVNRGDVLAEVETDKAVMDVEAFSKGFLSGPLLAEGETAPVGGAIGFIVKSADDVDQTVTGFTASAPVEQAATPTPTAAPSSAPRPTGPTPASRPADGASPFARNIAGQLGFGLDGVQGSGPGGAVLGRDVVAALKQQQSTGGGGAGIPLLEASTLQVPGRGRSMTGIELATAKAMAGSLTLPTFKVTRNIRITPLLRAAKASGVSVTVAIAQACALAMKVRPKMNAAFQPPNRIVERDHVDVGIAVDSGSGLIVPVLRGCESRDSGALAADWQDLVGRARTRHLKPHEWEHPTFTVSNMGMLGVDWFDAIPTAGTSAIVAISATNEAGLAPFTVSADHRVVNGADVAYWLAELKRLIEAPGEWLAPAGPAIPAGDWDYDVVVIGAGLGGQDCARDLVSHGLKVALVNDTPLPGGECLWRGCIPSKAWRAPADRMRDRADDARLGVHGTNSPTLDWSALERERRRILEQRGAMGMKADISLKIQHIQGWATFVDEHHLQINTAGNREDPHLRSAAADGEVQAASGDIQTVSFGCAVIATGAPPFVPPIPGAWEGIENGSVLTSDTVWHLPERPERVVVVGGGAIGLEMAQMFSDFGSEVTVLEAQDRLLAEVEAEIAKALGAVFEEEPRIALHLSARVTGISGEAGDATVTFTDAEGEAQTVTCDRVLMATGKRPKTGGLNLDTAGVKTDRGTILVDSRCRTSAPHIFAVGDVIGGLMLAHTAGQQGRVAAATIFGENRTYSQALDSGVIFTRPQAAFAGMTKVEAKAAGFDPVEVKTLVKFDAQAMIKGEDDGLIKLVVDKNSRRIVGVHMLADHADSLIGQAVMMVTGRLTVDQVAWAIHPHPTQTEMFGDIARRLAARLDRSRRKR